MDHNIGDLGFVCERGVKIINAKIPVQILIPFKFDDFSGTKKAKCGDI